MYKLFFKRLLDIVFSFIALVVLLPLLIIISILVRLKLGSPVIFKQERPGFNEKIFTIYKFCSMKNFKSENGVLLPDDKRLTSFGKKLRATSLDELPELWNIFKGDMSLVGPRPLSVKYLPYYYDNERTRHTVKPGLTGLAQINGRNSISWEDKFRFDIQYVNKVSFILDIKIVLNTIVKVLKKKDIGQADKAPISLHLLRQNKD